MTLFVGTSGWAYKEWKPDFYPEGLAQSQFLGHYSSVLSACEINATFYRLQSEETFTKWAGNTPEKFRFSIKAHRRLTHGKQIAPDGEQRDFLDLFLKSASVLGPRLGIVLFQFPPYRRRDDDSFERLLEALPEDRSFAFEFRHESWVDHEVYARIAAAGGAVCISNTDGTVPSALPPGSVAYVRLRTDRYSPEGRDAWLTLLRREAELRDVYAFTKHEGIPAGDPFGGIGLAQWLASASSA